MNYRIEIPALGRRAADVAVQILKGAKPRNIPIFQPTEFRTGHQSQDSEGARPHRPA
jgi:hypothetical protein